MNADAQIKRLLRARDQIDDAIDSLNTRGIIGPADPITGILLPSHKSDEDYTLLVFGRTNFMVCSEALVEARRAIK